MSMLGHHVMLHAVSVWLSVGVQEHRRIRGEYEARLRELEAERQMVEEDLAQVDK
jgi:hypothetical protein